MGTFHQSLVAGSLGARRCAALALLLLAGSACLAPSGARAAEVQFDLRSVFNADVVVNDGGGMLDPTQDAIDLGQIAPGNYCFPSQSVALRLSVGTPDGLPDDAVFAPTSFHPEVRLSWDNDDDGLNAWRVSGSVGVVSLAVPPAIYSEVHVFATTGDGSSDLTVSLLYEDMSVDATPVAVPDWFQGPVVGTPAFYYLVDGRDRMQPGSGPGIQFGYEESNNPAIFGFRFLSDPTKVLISVKLERTDTTGVLNVFGATGVTAPPPPSYGLYESLLAPNLVTPANLVATGVTSPIDHAPAMGRLVFLAVDDGAGDPALIYVTKGGSGVFIVF